MNIATKIITTSVAIAWLLAACGGVSHSKSDTPQSDNEDKTVMAALYDYRIVAEYPHSTLSYTQGLQYHDGVMWEGSGQEGESHLMTIDMKSGNRHILASLLDTEFGEGITIHRNHIYQLTWTSGKAYVYDLDGKLIDTKSYRGEGWGITSDGEHLYMSDGSSTIRRVNPDTMRTEASICVTYNGQPLDYINELEWIDGYIWANIYLTSSIVQIDPERGVVVGYIDLPELRNRLKNNPEAEVLNGIAYNPENGHLYVTGKDWNTLFEIEVIK